jgi:hypothetical protein
MKNINLRDKINKLLIKLSPHVDGISRSVFVNKELTRKILEFNEKNKKNNLNKI